MTECSVEQWLCTGGHGSAKNKELVLVISGETQLSALILLTNSHFESGVKISDFTLKGILVLKVESLSVLKQLL